MKDTASLSATIDKDLLKRIRVTAAKLGVSVNALITQQMGQFVDRFDHAEQASNENYQVLVEFSLGLRSASCAMKFLSLSSHAELNSLLAAAGLPKPTLPEKVVNQMVEELHAIAGM